MNTRSNPSDTSVVLGRVPSTAVEYVFKSINKHSLPV